MKNANQKKLVIIFANFIILGLIIYFVFAKPQSQQRKVSSVDGTNIDDASPLDDLNLNWQLTENGLIIRLASGEDDICKQWSNIDIVFKAEGLAYSGEVDRVTQTVACEDGQFQQTWVPNLTKIQGPEFQKSGVFAEEPALWVMDQMVLHGPGGNRLITSDDIRQEYDSVPTMVPKR